MKKTTILAGVVAGLAVALLAVLGSGGGTASADGGPHVASVGDATPDKCAGCHRIHTGQTDKLLKAAGTIQGFCYTCHGNGGPGSDLAVQEGTYYGETTPGVYPGPIPPNTAKPPATDVGLRAGGFEHARINTTDSTNSSDNPGAVTIGVGAIQDTKSYHAIDGTLGGTLWGNGAPGTGKGPDYTLECTSCHDPHGNGNYRILRPIVPDDNPLPAGVTAGPGVTIADPADP